MPAGTFLIGSHGAERARVTTFGLDRDVVQLTDEQADRLASLGARGGADRPRPRRRLGGDQADGRRRAHAPRRGRRSREPAEQEAIALGERLGSGVLHGKDVVEISVLRASKGEALTALRDELGAPVVLYAGDDVTDEHAFEALARRRRDGQGRPRDDGGALPRRRPRTRSSRRWRPSPTPLGLTRRLLVADGTEA